MPAAVKRGGLGERRAEEWEEEEATRGGAGEEIAMGEKATLSAENKEKTRRKFRSREINAANTKKSRRGTAAEENRRQKSAELAERQEKMSTVQERGREGRRGGGIYI